MRDFDIEVFFDGDCPLCEREIRMLKRLDRKHRVRFTDIASPRFNAQAVGLSYESLMDRIHGRLPSGEIIDGVEVLRALYAAVGFRRLVAFTRLPGINTLFEVAYNWFAKNRLRLTGRCDANGACPTPKRQHLN